MEPGANYLQQQKVRPNYWQHAEPQFLGVIVPPKI